MDCMYKAFYKNGTRVMNRAITCFLSDLLLIMKDKYVE